MRVIAIIPARGGSKRLEKKNIYPVNGKPMITYAIEACQKSKYINSIYVSSDDTEILAIGEKYGAIPLARPKELANDLTPKIEAIRQAVIDPMVIKQGEPDVVIIPQANSPQITAEQMDKGFDLLFQNNLWEVMSADENGVQNAAFRIVKMPHLFNTFLSAHCGFVVANCKDIHTLEDVKEIEGR